MPRFITHLFLFALVLTTAGAAFAQSNLNMPRMRPYDQRGLHVFEPAKEDTVANAPTMRWGVGFTQQIQALSHSNKADAVANAAVPGGNATALIEIGAGSNLATANLVLDAMLVQGVRVNLTTYLSSKHHPETWVKGGFVQIDEVGFLGSPALDNLFQHLQVRIGHFGINYGDQQFRRTDNGNAMHNPFVGNTIMDAFTTEVGVEVLARSGSFLAMVGATGGEIQGGVTRPKDRALSYLGKVGVDHTFDSGLRARLTGSMYTTASSARNTLYAGDRTGSRYNLVLENPAATTAAQFTSGRINPNLTDQVTAFMINPFVKMGGLEVFGVIEQATGRASGEAARRTWTQLSGEAIYRFMPREQMFVGARYNVVNGTLSGPTAPEVSLDRIQIGGGWFATQNVLVKLEYVNQNYNDFPTRDIRHGGRFNGFMLEGVIAF